MSGARVVATADNHLGRFYDRMSPKKLEDRRRYLRLGFRAAVDYALDWRAHLFVIAGDLFDTTDPRNIDRSFVANCLADLRDAGIRVFAIGGNHDTPRQSVEQGGFLPQEVYSNLGALTFFEETAAISTEYMEIEGYRLAIGGLSPDPAAPPGSDPLHNLYWDEGHAGADMSLLLLHGQVETYATPNSPEPVFALASLEKIAASAFIIGDIHRPAYKKVGGSAIVVPGATERMTFGENPEVPGFVALELSPGEVRYERIQLPGQPRVELEVRAADLDPAKPSERLIEYVAGYCAPETMVKLAISGIISRERYHSLSLRKLNESIAPRCFHFALDTSGLLVEDERHNVAKHGVRLSQQDEIKAYSAELLAQVSDPAEQEIINAALAQLLDRY